jgi:hypothetical protein
MKRNFQTKRNIARRNSCQRRRKMNKIKTLILFSLSALICAAPFIGVTHSAAEEQTITATVSLEGTIIAEDGREYVVVNDDMRKALLEYIGSRVLVNGEVSRRHGQWFIDVISIELLDDEDPENLERT